MAVDIDTNPYKPGHFILCRFPFRERPDHPGPTAHIAYCLKRGQLKDGTSITWLAYTTTAPPPPNVPVPPHIISISADNAPHYGQRKAFFIAAHRTAIVPVNGQFFPALTETSQGIVGVAPPHLHKAIVERFHRAYRAGLTQTIGPYSRYLTAFLQRGRER